MSPHRGEAWFPNRHLITLLMKETKSQKISGDTSVLGVLGDPINHSLSPVIQNAALLEMQLNWCYLAMPCSKENLKIVVEGLGKINCKGLNITIPHKTNTFGLCTDISSIAQEVGAINTLIPNGKGGWIGTNTDVEGFIKPLKGKINWSSKKSLVLGSGGSAGAVACGLKALNLQEITIVARKKESLNNLLESVNMKTSSKSSKEIKGILEESVDLQHFIKDADLIVNTTPVGMYKKSKNYIANNSIPYGEKVWDVLTEKTILYDLIYNPRPTEWLKIGTQKGCQTIDGLEMLIQQGAASLRLWSGLDQIPVDTMRKAATKHLLH